MLRPAGQQRDPAGPDRGGRAGARPPRRRLADLGCQGLRRQGGQPRRRRGVEVGQGRQDPPRSDRRLPQDDAGQDHRGPGRHRGRSTLAPSASSALQQPRRPRQLHDHAGNHEGAGRQPGAPGPPPVPCLRRRRLGHDALPVGRGRRRLQRQPEPHDRRRGGAVRQHRDGDGRRPMAAPAVQADRPQVGQPRRGERDRLRHRALRLPREEPG